MSDAESVALTVSGVTRSYETTHLTVGPVSFEVHAGECFGLVGANGAGKTTLLRLVLGLGMPDAGSISALGQLVVPFRPTLGVSGLIEEPKFFPWLNASDNLRAAFPQRVLSSTQITDLLSYVGLGDAGNQKVRSFSQGMRQRLGIGRVLMSEPSLMVLDEPTNGLDPVGIRWLRQVLVEQRSLGTAVILSSHMLHEVQAVSQTFMMIDHGKVVTSGRVEDITGVDGLEGLYFSAVASE